MKKFYFLKKLIVVCLSFFILLFIVPINYISADSPTPTYYELKPGDWKCVGTNGNQVTVYYNLSTATAPVRFAIGIDSGSYQRTAFVGESSGIKFGKVNRSACPVTVPEASAFNNATMTQNGHTYYYGSFTDSGFIPYNDIYTVNNNLYQNYAKYNYTYGPLSVGVPNIQPGILTYNYYTDFASNSQTTINAMKSNKDTITWDYDFDNSNISALDLKVDIRAIPVNYYSATEEDLKSLSWNSLNLNASLYADLGSYHINYNMRKISYTWEEVVDKIKYISNLPDIYNNLVNDWNFKIFNLNNYYYWTGWVYQIRLNTDSGDYVGEWQTIYQVSSAPPDSATTTINYYVNGTGVTEPIYQNIQNINNQNNITNNTWYVNGSPFNVDDDSTSNWWEQLLQFIRDIVAEILGFLGSIFDTLVSAILELVNSLGIDFLGLITQIINGIVNFFNNLDLTGSNFVLPSSFNNLIQSLSGSTNGILNIWFNNGLGMFIMIPLIIWLIGVVL